MIANLFWFVIILFDMSIDRNLIFALEVNEAPKFKPSSLAINVRLKIRVFKKAINKKTKKQKCKSI